MPVTAPEVCLFIVFYSISVVNVFSLILSLVRLAYLGFPGRLIGFSKRGCFKNPVTDSDLKWLIALCCTHDTKIMLYVNYSSIHTYIHIMVDCFKKVQICQYWPNFYPNLENYLE